MPEDQYEPISCDHHDELEAAATTRSEVELEFDRQGVRQRERGRIADVYTSAGAEWVRLQGNTGETEIRLDEIVTLRKFD